MEARRFDIVPIGIGWHVTDSDGVGRNYLTRQEAIKEGKALADQWSGPVQVFLWDRDNSSSMVFDRSEGRTSQ